ncbi:MAG: hypothetical protein ACLSF6_10345 [Evtepia gabavorous]
MENCLLPDSVAGFVEGEHCSVLLKALGDGHLRPIGSMVDASVRDRNKPGACYVYFRVMKRGETPIRMAFGSVGSSRMEYKARMLFRPRIWTASRGGYVSDRDGMGNINGTPFSQTKQRQTLETLLAMDWTGRGNAEVGIYGPVSMEDLDSAWCVFPFSLDRIQRQVQAGQRARRPQPVLVRPGGALPPGTAWGGGVSGRPKPGWRACLPRQSWRRRSGGTRVCRPTSPCAEQGRGLRGRAGTLDSIFPIGGRTMEQWEAMMGGKTFITDLGEERHAEINGVDTVVGRYAVWSPIRNASRHQIVEVGCDLQALVEKYQIPDSRVCVLA